MFLECLFHLAIITTPIVLYQLLISRKTFLVLPARVPILGFYGGFGAILGHLEPLRIWGISADFASVTIIVSMLFGKRSAGLLSALIFLGYASVSGHSQFANLPQVTIAVLLYCTLPFLLCHRFDAYTRAKRLWFGCLLSVVTVCLQSMVEILITLTTHPMLHHQMNGFWHAVGTKLLPVAGMVAGLQCVFMLISILMMDTVILDGRNRLWLHETAQRYHSLIQMNPLAVVVLNSRNEFVMVNKAYEQLTGYASIELIGRSRFMLWFPEDREMANQIVEAMERGEIRRNVHYRLRHKNGDCVDILCTNIPMIVNDHFDGYMSIAIDQTRSRELDNFIRKTETLASVGQLAAGIAHEIRNPLTAIMGFLKLIEEKTDDAVAQDYFQIVRSELAQVELISSELLVLGKPQSDAFTITDTNDLIHSVLLLLAPLMNMKSIQIVTRLHASSVGVYCVPNQLKQVFVNLLRNAIDAVREGGTIWVTTERQYDHVVVTVQDDGIGMTEETIQRLGEPFYTTKTSGTGLGLMVSYQILHRHGGSILYESQPFVGTTVRVTLDASLRDRQAAEEGEVTSVPVLTDVMG